MRFLSLTSILGLIAAGLLTLNAAAASHGEQTIFKGRFVCDVNGEQVPVAGARVGIFSSSASTTGGLFGGGGDVFESSTPAQRAFTGADGEFSFQVPFNGGEESNQTNYRIVLWLDDGGGLVVRRFPTGDAAAFDAGKNQNDQPEQDYHTQDLSSSDYRGQDPSGTACAAWLTLKQAITSFQAATGFGSPPIKVDYGAPTSGVPWADYTTVEWPDGYDGGDLTHPTGALHTLAEVIRNVTLGGAPQQHAELAGTRFTQQQNSCEHTTPAAAFYEGWAEFWSGELSSVPTCREVQQTDVTVPGMVAWRLTSLERLCPADTPHQLVSTLVADGKTIHSLTDYEQLLPRCDAGFVDASEISSYTAAPAVTLDQRLRALDHATLALDERAKALSNEADAASRAAASANCSPQRCTQALAATMSSALLAGQAAQTLTIERTLRRTATPQTTNELAGTPSTAFMQQLREMPIRLTRQLAAIGTESTTHALTAARPLLARAPSTTTRSLVTLIRQLTTSLATARRRGFGLPISSSGQVTETHRTTEDVYLKLSGIPDHTPLTKTAGFAFGADAANGFRGKTSAYLCPDDPTVSGGNVLAPICAARDAGFQNSGLLIHLTTLARTVGVNVGTTESHPGGFAVQLDAFDAGGHLLTQTAVLVGSTTNDQTSGPTAPLKVELRHATIAYLALFFNAEIQPGAQLVFNNLTYSGD